MLFRSSGTQLLITFGTVIMLAVIAWIAISQRTRLDPGVSVVAALGGYLLFAPYVLPWYPAWVIPTIGLTARASVARLLALQGAGLVIVYELKTQSLTGWVASGVWWVSVLGSTALGVLFFRAVRSKPLAPALTPQRAG